MAANDKMRADQLLTEKGVFESRSRARQEILAGTVFVDGERLEKPSQSISTTAQIALAPPENPYVSRGGLKLAHALDQFGLSPIGLDALDIGASTGGFTEVLLNRGAKSVAAIDVGQGQMHLRLRNDPRVTVWEKTDIRNVTVADFRERPQFAVCDVSFISLLHILPDVFDIVAEDAQIVLLIKPQFEVGRDGVEKRGIVKDEGLIADCCARIRDRVSAEPGWKVLGMIESPVTGGDGNREFLLGAERNAQ